MDNATQPFYGHHSSAAHEFGPDDEDGELECRICRGPAEEGRPLFSPCKCSGSIGLTHQDCLKSWLSVTRGDRCELCTVPFKFAPKYADNAPDKLPLFEVIAGVFHRASVKWLPFAIRATIAIILWICVLPLATAYLYYGWMHRPSSVVQRWKLELVATDMVAGGIVAGSIIISFLSLMSLADVLRVHLQQPIPRENPDADDPLNAAQLEDEEEDFDADIFPYEADVPENTDLGDIILDNGLDLNNNPRMDIPVLNQNDNMQRNGPHAEVDREPVNAGPQQPQQPQQPELPGLNANQNVDNRFEPQFEPMAPVQDQDDGMDIHVALDELLGLRGPLSGLIRNLLWLLAFNTIYLGVFTCLPYSIGKRTFTALSDSEIFQNLVGSLPTLSYNDVTIAYMIDSLNTESVKRNPVLQLPDLAVMTLGYLSFAILVFLFRSIASLILFVYKNGTFKPIVYYIYRRGREDLDSPRNNVAGLDANQFIRQDHFRFERENNVDVGARVLTKLKGFLDGFSSVVKVGLVLFIKMLFLPLFLGLMLDFATLSLFNTNIHERIVYAGKDLFGSILIHWVSGITFMLMVTVSVLQLREVVHPDLLAKVIRPQEPQSDLLGTILQETGFTHTRRMILSLTIYIALLVIYVGIPAQILVSVGAVKYLPLFQPKVWNIVLPEIQFPIEMLIFHMSMLALLEKYKNNIGQMLHRLLLTMCDLMNITNYILPKSVAKFELVGLRPVYIKKDHKTAEVNNTEKNEKLFNANDNKQETKSAFSNIQIDPFWKTLAEKGNSHDDFISMSLNELNDKPIFEIGITKNNGQRVLSTQSYIRISSEKLHESNVSVPTSSGRYRFRLHYRGSNAESPKEYSPKIEVWKEVIGEPLFRPPDGWDDLGAGGAEVQGRWAWAKEVKSDIEEGVAKRINFKSHPNKLVLAIKLILLLVFFWGWNIFLLVSGFNMPLFIGRSFFMCLHVPDKYYHDPVAFALGASVLFPVVKLLWASLGDEGLSASLQKLSRWTSSFHLPYSREKNRIVLLTCGLWTFVIPMLVGMIYYLCIVLDRKWWETMSVSGSIRGIAEIWIVGFILFHIWAITCFSGMCTKDFWTRFRGAFGGNENGQGIGGGINGLVNRNANENDNEVNNIDFNTDEHWQGKNGRIGQFLRVVEPVLTKWEWEKVDHEILLQRTLFPITKQLFITAFLPYILLFFILQLQLQLSNTGVGSGLINIILFRCVSFSMFLIQIGSIFKAPLEKWFQAAHRTARDERYLVGETLLDYKKS